MVIRRKYTKELLEPLVAQSASVSGVMRLLGLRQNGGAHTHVSRTIKALGIDTSHFRPYVPQHIPNKRQPSQVLIRLPVDSSREKPHVL